METINSRLINWASILDEKTREQALATSRLPFIYPHVALMPDAHLGGATVGSVIPTLGAIIPAAVGVDIGCGMIAVADPVRPHGSARRPEAAAGGHRARRAAVRRPQQPTIAATAEPRLAELRGWPRRPASTPASTVAKWELQLGSLGSGNHFIEVCADETDAVWLFLHSGSRGVGNKIAQRHITEAQSAARRQRVVLPDRGPGVPGGGHARIRPGTSANSGGPSTSPC